MFSTDGNIITIVRIQAVQDFKMDFKVLPGVIVAHLIATLYL